MEYWSFGVMGENRTAKYHPYYRSHRNLIICLDKVIGQKQFQSGVEIIIATLTCPGTLFPILQYSITPVLLWFKSIVHFGDKPKPGPQNPDSLLAGL